MYKICLMGYKNINHTNYWPWLAFYNVFTFHGYNTCWIVEKQIEKSDIPRIFILCDEPEIEALVKNPNFNKEKDIILQKVKAYGKGHNNENWTSNPKTYFESFSWDVYGTVVKYHKENYNVYAFGCKTNPSLFLKKKEYCDYLQKNDRLFWIPWGSCLFSYDEIQAAVPILDGFQAKLGFVGGRWGVVGRGNVDSLDEFFNPIYNYVGTETCFVGGKNQPLGYLNLEEHKQVLRKSKFCPIINCASWREEEGIQDRFWSVFSCGRFGVTDSKGVLGFFDDTEVVYSTDPKEYFDLSKYYYNNIKAQRPYIENTLKKIKNEYNYFITWKNIIEKIVKDNNL